MIDVLLVEDNPADARLCVEILAESRENDFDVTHAVSLQEAFDRLDHATYHVVLLDLGLPESTGLDTLRRFKEHSAEVPVVVLTGLADEKTGHDAVGMGAQDYLVKGFAKIEHLLPRAIRYGMERAELSRALARHQRLELIAQISGGVAHDFNNILASIMGFTDLAIQNLDAGDAERITNYLNRIRNSAIRGRDLVRQLLLFGRPDERPMVENLDLTTACEDIVSNIRPLMPSSVALEWVAGASSRVDVDQIHLHQIIMNLVINARDALGGRGTIRIGVDDAGPVGSVCSACGKRAGGRFTALVVSDTGPGIDPEVLPHVFEPYVTSKSPEKGSGMGLSVVSHLCTAMADISCSSRCRARERRSESCCRRQQSSARKRARPSYLPTRRKSMRQGVASSLWTTRKICEVFWWSTSSRRSSQSRLKTTGSMRSRFFGTGLKAENRLTL